ncbi:MAG: DUF3795 domain-containing protein [Candidatus Helarchaeota archaeon]
MPEDLKEWHAPCGIYCKMCPGVKAYGCRGCRTEKGQVHKLPICETYQCVIGKGHDFCYECEEFPCERLMPIVNYEIFIPNNSKVFNLVMIEKLGIEEWNKRCEEITTKYYKGKKIRYGGDKLTLKKKDPNLYKKKKN